MLEAALEALNQIFTLERMLWMLGGVFLGLFLGFMPGIGGVVGMSLLLPFMYGMDPYTGIALMIGMIAVMHTGDTFPAVLIGLPGSAGGQATIMDGYPMARKGQAGRALGAGFFASMLGGLFGAAVLFAILPIARPLVLAFGSPELFMMTLIGLSLVAILSKGAPLKGVLAGLLGMLISTVGIAPATTDLRFTFDIAYLYGGFGLVLIALGAFAIPEIVELFVENKKIAKNSEKLSGGIGEGMRDTLKNWPLVIQGSAIGSVLGMIPGIGGAVINWLCYGLAASTVRKDNQFGRGDVRGVIAPEAGNNAAEGGNMVPTMLFGIPSSATTAIILGALVLMGVQPGPSMLEEENMPLLLMIVWTLALATVLGTGLCILLARPISLMTIVPARRVAPFLVVVIILAAFQTTRNWADIVVVLILGLIAFVMKQLQWPRIPLLIGFVLGPASERYFTVSVSRFGFEWLTRPGVLALMAVLAAAIVFAVLEQRKLATLAKKIKEKVAGAAPVTVAAMVPGGEATETFDSNGNTNGEDTVRSSAGRSDSARRDPS
ncbi:TctA family transporter [Arthrobacter ginsengisoli]|uniref:TctA family transporter n=1 Tax=Arthrobacter ginsengisoli TaxID=1356565 RepID=A0ABU1UDR2_9MICC|nr:tripartite tricarboxylate transporter permease [Arthrobacter ginsengisoli]MDR7083332.1 TctA family transporter [Arthrobacter ginsengisoli]